MGLDHERFRLRPLAVEHNPSDHVAWSSSIDHIRATPGYAGLSWPQPMTLAENQVDLERHASDFHERIGFTFTVLAPDLDTVIGCVYIYPSERTDCDARVRSWVRAQDADLDPVLHSAVERWLADAWPFRRVESAPRAR